MSDTAFLGKAFRTVSRGVKKGARTAKRTAINALPAASQAAGSALGAAYGGPVGARVGGALGGISGRAHQRLLRGKGVSARAIGRDFKRTAIREGKSALTQGAGQALGPMGNMVGGRQLRKLARSKSLTNLVKRSGGARRFRALAERGARRAMSRAMPKIGPAQAVLAQVNRLSPEARRYLVRELSRRIQYRDTMGLSEDGRQYIVEAGESPWLLAQKLTGNGNRYRELLRANPQHKKNADGSNFAQFFTGMRLNLPDSWVREHTSPPPETELPPVVPVIQPAPVNVPATEPLAPIPSIVAAPSAIPAAPGQELSADQVKELKAVLIAWADTDGEDQPGLADYGNLDRDYGASFTERDGFVLMAFARFVNASSPAKVSVTTEPKLEHFAAAVAWANVRGAADGEVRSELGAARGAVGTGRAPSGAVQSGSPLPPPVGAVPVVVSQPAGPVSSPEPEPAAVAEPPEGDAVPGKGKDAGLALLATLALGGAALL